MSSYIFIRAQNGYNNPYFFWAIWVFFVLTIVQIAFKFNVKYYVFGMVLFQVLLGIIWVFGQASPLPIGTDAIFESQYAGTLVDTGKWDPKAGVGLARNYYGFAPLIHTNIASISLVTGDDVFSVGKFFPFLERIFYFLVLFVFLRKLVGDKIAILSTLFIFSSPQFILIHTSRRLFAEPFLLLILLIVFYQFLEGRNITNQKYLILLPLFFICVIIGHHMTFYFLVYFLAFILIVILFSIIKRKLRHQEKTVNKEKISKLGMIYLFVILIILSFIGMQFLINSTIFNWDMVRLQGGIDAILSLKTSSASSTASDVGSGLNYPKIYVYLSFVFVGLFYLFLFFSLKYIKKLKNNFLIGLSIASALLLFVPVVAILSGTRTGKLFGTVGWGLGAIGMVIPVGYFIKNWWQKGKRYIKTILAVALILMYCGGLLIAYPIHFYCSDDTKPIINEKSVQAGSWLQSNTDPSEVIGGDRYSYEVVSGKNLRLMRYDLKNVYSGKSLNEFSMNLSKYAEGLIVQWYYINDIITKYPIASTEAIPGYKLEWVDQSVVINKLYATEGISIYFYDLSE